MTTTRDAAPALDTETWSAVNNFIDKYVHPDPFDDIVIVSTPDSRVPAAWVALAFTERGFAPSIIPMLALHDPGFQERLSAVVPPTRESGGRCVCLIFELHTMSHNRVVKQAFCRYAPTQYQVIRAINSGRELFTVGLAVDPGELSALNATLLERCKGASSMRIRAPGGTDLSVGIDNTRFRWMSNRGINAPGKFLIVPPGEVATFPSQISGTLVADFALNVNMYYEDDVRLDSSPISVDIVDGRLIDFHCDNATMRRFLGECFSRPNAKRVGELGLGTNKAVVSAVPENSHLNERVPGVHLGFGAHNQTSEATGYSCDVHVDLCAKGGQIWFDDSDYPLDLEAVPPSKTPHPELISSEDIFSDDAEDDCCGILT